MAKCDICGRGAFFGNQVSHSHRRSNKVWHANVQILKGLRKNTPVCPESHRTASFVKA